MADVFVLFCSPHKNGSSRKLLDEALGSLGECRVTSFDAFDLNASPCNDCGYCSKNDGCVKHDLDGLYQALEAADILIFASPVYFLSLPAPAKAIVDRMQRYYGKRFFLGVKPPIEKPKRTMLLLSYESDRYGGISHITEQFNMLCTILNSSSPEVTAGRTQHN